MKQRAFSIITSFYWFLTIFPFYENLLTKAYFSINNLYSCRFYTFFLITWFWPTFSFASQGHLTPSHTLFLFSLTGWHKKLLNLKPCVPAPHLQLTLKTYLKSIFYVDKFQTLCELYGLTCTKMKEKMKSCPSMFLLSRFLRLLFKTIAFPSSVIECICLCANLYAGCFFFFFYSLFTDLCVGCVYLSLMFFLNCDESPLMVCITGHQSYIISSNNGGALSRYCQACSR